MQNRSARILGVFIVVVLIVAGYFLIRDNAESKDSPQGFAALAATGCTYPTGSITHAKQTAYDACRFDELLNAMPPQPTATTTVTVTATPTPTPTTPTSTTATPTPTDPTSSTTTPTPTTPTSTPPSTGFPDASNTGPTGPLTTSSGNPWLNQPGTVIENRLHTGTIQVAAANVIIRNSQINGNIVVDEGAGGSVTIIDTLVRNGSFNVAGIGGNNMTIRRTEVIGGGHSISCKQNCDIQDSWVHAQDNPSSSLDVHGDGILFNVADNMIVKHNTLACDMPADGGGACSAGLAMYGDWGPVRNVLVDGNLFKASPAGYCTYGGNVAGKPYGASNVDYINNVFEKGSNNKCAVYGPYSARATDGASSWTGNKWADGTALN